ncbi:hypothetical protein [Kocuria flava]|uniref:hypothetical protein n=1 Tax=Kocuria flava TaxID=446860 RepID=UPI002F952D8D
MNMKKLTTALASAALAASFVVAPVAPANAGPIISAPKAPGYVICKWWPVFC